ncbi:MAG: Lar family restriction alleviation protein [Porticoccaceae bacterium]|nr:Lar family restriction alleviation protein [Porticoccaceae bacterium]
MSAENLSILPCPFCGQPPVTRESVESAAHPGQFFPEAVMCRPCKVNFVGPKAIERWNTRTANLTNAGAIHEFANSMVGALERGFIDKNNCTIAEIHRIAQNHIKDRYAVEVPGLAEEWGPETARLCGFGDAT